ncbi:MAG: hypothetical protein U0836_24055 [Pirellulales bacterium]
MQVTVDVDFQNNIAINDPFLIGKPQSGNPDKVLQLTRSFNSGARRVEVYPQKNTVKYTGF